MGLLLGASALSLVELLDFLIWVVLFNDKKQSKNNRAEDEKRLTP